MSTLEPTCLGIVLCDQVIEDKRTNKKSYIGAFNDIMVGRLPATHNCMYLVVSLTNCRVESDVEVEISRQTDQGGERILHMKGKIGGRNPLDVIDLVFELRGIPLASYGQYTVDIAVMPGNRRIAQRSFYVRSLPKPPEGPPK